MMAVIWLVPMTALSAHALRLMSAQGFGFRTCAALRAAASYLLHPTHMSVLPRQAQCGAGSSA